MRIHMPGMDMTLEAAADLSTHQYKFVVGAAAVAGGQQARVNVSGANGRNIGVLQNKPPTAGQGAVVRVSGRSKLQVDTSAILVGSPLKSGAAGEGTLAAANNDKVGAIAMEANGGAAVIIDVLIVCYDLGA
jgi:hypothetical protein